jgi:nucleoside 2-deoxyribosyltransferase
MAICFVIQPFEDKYDKRFDDIYKPAIEAADLDAYRSDRDRSVEVPIDTIEAGIRDAAVCLADITTDNPNVWYELGYAFAAARPVVMVCSTERNTKYPFDIQHRTVIRYRVDSTRDFEELKHSITETIKARLDKRETLRQIAEKEQLAPVHGLTQTELVVLAVIASKAYPQSGVSMWSAEQEVERSGFTSLGFSLGIRRLKSKKLIESSEIEDAQGDLYNAIMVTEKGWEWIEANESLFTIRRPTSDDTIPPFDISDLMDSSR